jgi:hypothetical protein
MVRLGGSHDSAQAVERESDSNRHNPEYQDVPSRRSLEKPAGNHPDHVTDFTRLRNPSRLLVVLLPRGMMEKQPVKRVLKPITYILAAVYLCADLVFAGVAAPVSRWLARHFEMRRLRGWIQSLPPYACLALLAVPVIVLEPVKFLAAYLAATGKVTTAVLVFCVGELLKLVLIERLFDLTRDRLMRIPAFAWTYGQYKCAREWIARSEAWQVIRSTSLSLLHQVKSQRYQAPWRLVWNQSDR